MAISEAELILPALYLIGSATGGVLSTKDLIDQLRILVNPSTDDLELLDGRTDDKFSQKVRNLVSHNSLQRLGLASYNSGIFQITTEGIDYLNVTENIEVINEKYLADYEGVETINHIDDDSFTEVSEVYPQASLNIERTQFSVFELRRKLEKKKLILDPDFQRNDVWKARQKAELVESILMSIPLPFIYLTENRDGELIVVDGRQRLTALFEFIDNKFSLGNKLQILKGLKGKKFQQLNPLMQGTIEDYQLVTHIIKPPISDRVLIDIFDRVNRGGTSLSNQEIRNALYQGKSTKLLTALAKSEEFKSATDNSIKNDRMKDKYLILRYVSFYYWRKFYKEGIKNGLVDYKGDTEEFLPKYMQYINRLPDEEISTIEHMFKEAMNNTVRILGNNAFRLPRSKNVTIKRPISMALFELISYWMSHSDMYLKEDLVKAEYESLLSEKEFLDSFLSIDNTTKYRFDKIDSIVNKIRNAE